MSDPEIYNAGDEAQVKGRGRKADLARRRELDDLKQVMSSAAGRRLVWRALGYCGVHRSSFSTNAIQMSYSEGRRNVGLWLESEVMEVSPEHYLLMQQEAFTKEKSDTTE